MALTDLCSSCGADCVGRSCLGDVGNLVLLSSVMARNPGISRVVGVYL